MKANIHYMHPLFVKLYSGWYLLLFVILIGCSTYDDRVLDNKLHGVPCTDLPTIAEVNQIITTHQSEVQQILNVNPGQVFFDIDRETCPTKASIVISYPSHKDRVAIEAIIGGDTFFNIPYDLLNQ
ncbi:MAG: hypothetical protein HC804_03230 [Anaerolineae bacterium]|nr:hypothetical protein [Anaerolineae bacterium]